MEITIQSNVPMPGPAHRKYPFHQMKVGDSFFLEKKTSSAWGSVNNSARLFAKKNGGKFSTRAVLENGVKGVRVWRVE